MDTLARNLPRLALLGIWIFGDLLGRAFESWLAPVIGFFLLPWTTVTYAVMWSSADRVFEFEWFIVGLAFVGDLAVHARRRHDHDWGAHRGRSGRPRHPR